MLFDDRLATVLRTGAAGERAARTQFRQLLDLLGSAPAGVSSPLVLAAYRRLAEIQGQLPAADQSRILREPWLRLRNPRLLAHLAEGDPQAAAAAMAVARLDDEQWVELIPELPVIARGFLRHRRDLPAGARALLSRLGVRDLVLPQPDGAEAPAAAPAAAPPRADAAAPARAEPARREPSEGISALVRRIEAFRQARQGPAELAPRLPLDEGASAPPAGSCDFASDAAGRIAWAEPGFAPLLAGLSLASAERLDSASLAAMRQCQPLRGGRVRFSGVAAVSGEWRIDAVPHFTASGAFAGYRGRFRRQPPPGQGADPASPAAERMRQMLHELRTPVGAIQGFAEIIQQQLFGPAPNAYRALAAAVGVDAARLLAGFDELDRMVRLESGETILAEGGSDLQRTVEDTLRRLDGVLRPRSAKMRLLLSGESFAVGLGAEDAAQLVWRLLASLAGSLAPGEVIELALRSREGRVELAAELPLTLASADNIFAVTPPAQAPAVTAGMFGSGFTFRLARAEAEAAGGSLVPDEETLVLALPALTRRDPAHSEDAEADGRKAS